MQRRTRRRRHGFTLIELLLVAGILAVLAAFAIPSLMGTAEKAKNDIARAGVKRNGPIAKGLDQYKWDVGRFPDTDEGLQALFVPKGQADNDNYKGPYMMGVYEELLDPWNTPYEYRSPGDMNEEGYDLWSAGSDREDNSGKEGSDDVKNWLEK